MSTTAARRRLVRSLVTDRVVGSQRALVDILSEHGFQVTQATASRDLRAVGAVKDGDGYVIADPRHAEAAALRSVVEDYAESIEASGNLIVIRTPPGAAHLVAASLDAAPPAGIIGTVAGDDTLLVVVDESTDARAIALTLEGAQT